MAKINLLQKEISELIAAGEVIERPASIVKELVENSIDAGATAITVEIKYGGIRYIRISDNGCGIASEDIVLAFKRHATSKVVKAIDLDNIGTLGFRGEALASIAAVSRVSLESKTASQQFGAKVELEGGEQVSLEEAGCPNGTTIIVRDLFYNVPARLKFLKKDASEGNVISGMIDKLCLSHPEVSFKLIADSKPRLHTPGNGDLLSAIHAVFGKEFSGAMIPVDYEYNGVKVCGFTSKTANCRSNRAMQHFFVNSRYVRSKICTAATEEGYKNSIMIGKFPFCVLNVLVAFSAVDVNVHPAKIEVRFVNERVIFDGIYFAIKAAIAGSNELTAVIAPLKSVSNPLSTFKNEALVQTKLDHTPKSFAPKIEAVKTLMTSSKTLKLNSTDIDYPAKSAAETPIGAPLNFQYIKDKNFKKQPPKKPTIKLETPPIETPLEDEIAADKSENTLEPTGIKIIGELFKTYILCEVSNNLILFDKHAAHERIIFEKLKATIDTKHKQQLLKPIILTLSTDECEALLSNVDLLCDMGFSYDEFGGNSVAVREVPIILADYNVEEILLDIAKKLTQNKRDVQSDIFQGLLQSMSCKMAIRGNDISSTEELEALLKGVLKNDEIRHCPHGRPIATIISRAEIEKRFGRI